MMAKTLNKRLAITYVIQKDIKKRVEYWKDLTLISNNFNN